MKNEINKVIKEIQGADTIGLMTHVNGDGDAFGSLLGLRNILESLGKKVILFSNEKLPDYFNYLKKEARYNPVSRYQKVDLLIGLDLPSVKRFTVPNIFEKAKENGVRTLIVDHHTDGDLYKVVDLVWQKTDISSTSEMIYWLMDELDIEIDKSTAEFLLWGVETDTYFLSNPNVYESTHHVQKALWGHGASTENIKENVKAVSPTGNKELMDIVLGRQIEIKQGVLFTYVTQKDKEKTRIDGAISSAIANYIDYFDKPRVVVVAEQRTPKIFKVSMRSNHSDVDVSRICKNYGGGGHVKASGFEMEGKVEDFVQSSEFKRLVSQIK